MNLFDSKRAFIEVGRQEKCNYFSICFSLEHKGTV